jgi:plastocyanin
MRRMLRRAALAAGLLLLLTGASASAATKTVTISATTYTPSVIHVAMGDSIKWSNATRKVHTVSSDSAMLASWFFPNKRVAAHKTSTAVTFPEAGTFSYHDPNSGALRGKVVVPLKTDATSLPVGVAATITMGTTQVVAPMIHILQERFNGGAWKTVYSSYGNTVGFTPTSAGTWEFQTYIHHALSGWNTGTSPILTITAY